MNSAARLLNQSILSRDWIVSALFSKSQLAISILVATVVMSALSIVWVTNATRGINANMQQLVAERNRLHVEWGQLLLEKSTWIMQARVQQIAEDKLGMVEPVGKSVVVVNE